MADRLDEVVLLHNKERAKFGLDDLKRTSALDKEAQQWADVLSSTNTFAHSHKPGLGECIAYHYPIKPTSPTILYYLWENEKVDWKKGKYPDVTKNGKDTGHYNQIIWGASNTIGVGYSENKKTGKAYLVTNYLPPGNVYGQYPF